MHNYAQTPLYRAGIWTFTNEESQNQEKRSLFPGREHENVTPEASASESGLGTFE
jgi:hypothetical protein